MGVPQILLIILYAISVIITGFLHGKPQESEHNVGMALLSTAIVFALLLWGGFFSK